MNSDLLAGRYEMIERLAGGGMGQVFRGRDQVLERIVAVKTVDLGAQDPTARERFRREAVATAGLSAPNVVQVYDAGVDGDTAYLVMELLTGPSVSQLVHDHGPLSIEQGMHISQEVTKGLLAAHRIGVVHRDVKPGNVMYHGDQIKLVDFGIAQLARTMGAQLTAPATAMGTAAYMAPEQATGEGATEKSDWYALGCLMMTMFTGDPPFAGEALAVATQQITAQPPSLAERRPEIPPALDQLVTRLLSKNPNDRPSGEQVLDQLRLLRVDPNAGTIAMPAAAAAGATAVLPPNGDDTARTGVGFARTPTEPSGPVVPAPPPPPLPAQVGPPKRRIWPAVIGLLLVLLVGVGTAFAVFNLTQGPSAPPGTTPSPEASATATSTPTPTSGDTTTRRTTTRPPATTRPPTTRPPTTSAPPTAAPTSAPTTQPTGDATTSGGETTGNGNSGSNGSNGNSGNGNSGNGNSGNGNSDSGDSGGGTP